MIAGAGLLLVDPSGRVLLARRSEEVSSPGTWASPGGHVEPGESPDAAAVREFEEEMGTRPVFRPAVVLQTGDDPQYFTLVGIVSCREAERLSRDIRLNWENDGAVWAHLSRPPRPLHPALALAWPLLVRTLL